MTPTHVWLRGKFVIIACSFHSVKQKRRLSSCPCGDKVCRPLPADPPPSSEGFPLGYTSRISTQLLFSQKTLTRNQKSSKFCAYQQTPSDFGNNFEPLARSLYPEVDEAMQYLDQFGTAKLTGTGACVFTEVTEEMNVNDILNDAPCKSYLVSSLQESPLRQFKV